MENCQSLLKIHLQIMYMGPCSQLILFFHYIFFDSVDLKYYENDSDIFSAIEQLCRNFPLTLTFVYIYTFLLEWRHKSIT